MDPIGWQVLVRARDNRVLVGSEESRRKYVRSVLTCGEHLGLYTHGVSDTHGHNGIAGDRVAAVEFGRRLVLSLGRVLPHKPAFEPPKILPINDQRHLLDLLRYCLRQDSHHAAGLDPLREGTAVFDYLGLRPAGWFLRPRIRTLLPRLTSTEIARNLPVKLVEACSLPHLTEAISSANLGNIASQERIDVSVRIAAVHAAAEFPTHALAAALGMSARQVRRYRSAAPNPAWVTALRLQMGLRRDFSLTGRSAMDWPDTPHPGLEYQ